MQKIEKTFSMSDSPILLDMGQFKELKEIEFWCGSSWNLDYGKLNLEKCKKLKVLSIGPMKESATVMDLTMFTNLVSVNLSGDVEKVDVHGLKKLEKIACISSNVKDLNVRNCTGLNVLDVCNNPIETLDLTTNVNLKALYCYATNIKSLDLNKNLEINDVFCDEGTTLDGVDTATVKIRRRK